MGIYLGRSPAHAGNVALVLNPKTGLVSPQYHVVFDDDFTTVPHLQKGTVPSNWEKLVLGSRERLTDEFINLTKTWLQPTSDETADKILETRREKKRQELLRIPREIPNRNVFDFPRETSCLPALKLPREIQIAMT